MDVTTWGAVKREIKEKLICILKILLLLLIFVVKK